LTAYSPVAVPEPQITWFCAPQPMDAKVPDAEQIGGTARGRVKAPTTICDEQHGDNPRIGVGTIPVRVPGTRRCGHMPASNPVSSPPGS
jgi:hypothetical protein